MYHQTTVQEIPAMKTTSTVQMSGNSHQAGEEMDTEMPNQPTKSFDKRLEFKNTQKYLKDVLILLFLKAIALNLHAHIKMIYNKENKYYGINFEYLNLMNEPLRQYFISCERYHAIKQKMAQLKSIFSNCPLIVVTTPEYQENPKPQTDTENFLKILVQTLNGKSNEGISYCSFDKKTLKMETMEMISCRFGKTKEGDELKTYFGKKEINIVLENLYSQVEECFDELYESKPNVVTIDFAKLQDEIRKDLFGYIGFKKQKVSDNFVGRTKELINVSQALNDERIAVITGAFGVGKTELAKRYAESSKKSYENVVWIDCRTKRKAMKAFEELATEHLLIVRKGTDYKTKDINTIVTQVFNFFRNKRTLFVFDGAVDKDSVFLPPPAVCGSTLDMIVTARKRYGWNEVSVIELQPFDEEETKEYLEKNGYEDTDSLQIASKDLEGSPWLLSRWVRGELKSKDFKNYGNGKEKPLTNVFPDDVAMTLARLYLTQEDETQIDESLDILENLPNGELLKKILTEMTLSKEIAAGIQNFFKHSLNKTDVASAINTLLDYYFIKIEKNGVIMYRTVKLVLFQKWTSFGKI